MVRPSLLSRCHETSVIGASIPSFGIWMRPMAFSGSGGALVAAGRRGVGDAPPDDSAAAGCLLRVGIGYAIVPFVADVGPAAAGTGYGLSVEGGVGRTAATSVGDASGLATAGRAAEAAVASDIMDCTVAREAARLPGVAAAWVS